MRKGNGAGLGEEAEAVIRHRGVQWRALFLPIRDQLIQGARIEHRAGQDVRAYLRAFFEDTNRAFRQELLEASADSH